MTAHDITATVMKDMLPVLNNWQLEKLESSLVTALNNVEVRAIEEACQPATDDNERLVKLFLAAKSVEGCSPRTVSYYESTLSKALAAMGKHASLVTTNDLRQ